MSETKKTEAEAKSSENAEAPAPKPFMTFKGRSFGTEAEATAFMEGLASSQGTIAQKYGELMKEAEPLRKYNLKQADVDEIDIMKKVEKFRNDGENTEADRLLFEYVRQVKSDSTAKQEEERLWTDYVRSRKDIFDVLDEDLAKSHVFTNYRSKLQDEENPFEFIDRVLAPKASRLKPKQETDGASAPSATLGSGNSTNSAKTTSEEKNLEETSDGSWDKVLDEFGFK